jgi:hypothetical protein
VDFERISKNEEQALINLIYFQEGLVGEFIDIIERLEKKDSNLLVLTSHYYFGHK